MRILTGLLLLLIFAALYPTIDSNGIAPFSSANPDRLATPESQTPSTPENVFQGKYFINGSFEQPVTNTTMDVGAVTMVDFIVRPGMNVTGAVLNMTVPSIYYESSGQKVFQGDIPAGEPVDLRVAVQPFRETSTDIGVVATGNVTEGDNTRQIRELYFLGINTTLWPSLTHPVEPLPNDPYYNSTNKNSTVMPMYDVTGFPLSSSQSTTQLYVSPNTHMSTTVTGRLAFINENGRLARMRFVKVELWDEGFCVGFRCGLAATTFTDAGGFFTMSLSVSGSISWHISVFPESCPTGVAGCSGAPNAAEVRPCPIVCWYEAIADKRSNVPDGTSISLGTLIPAGANPAWEVYDALLNAFLGLSGTGGTPFGFTPGWRETAIFPLPWCVPGTPFPPTPSFWPPGAPWPTVTCPALTPFTDFAGSIWMPAKAVFPWMHPVIHHEYGHAIMINTMGISNYPCRVTNGCFPFAMHTFTTVDTSGTGGFAFQEGWGEFTQAFIDMTFATNLQQLSDAISNAADASGNIETNTWLAASGASTGNVVEGTVATILWDMVDPNILGGDCFPGFGCDSLPSSTLSGPAILAATLGTGAPSSPPSVFVTDTPGNLLAFFTSFVSRAGITAGSSDFTALCNIFRGNGVTPASCLATTPTLTFAGLLVAGIMTGLVIHAMRSRRHSRDLTQSTAHEFI